eukprot:TRINITY_DN2283_c0_g1_i1.p1 TRINITY_DN2283_c0_g1~~TRINITY_DN2283_c0_g1_i1.p1  ORF type:complete len:300 (+),score=30.16 TRINITY_DN2283_c0_g1_i1:1170-2069(+)
MPIPRYKPYARLIKQKEDPIATGNNIPRIISEKNQSIRKELKENEKAQALLMNTCTITEVEYLDHSELGAELEDTKTDLVLLDTAGSNEYLLSSRFEELQTKVSAFSDVIVYVINFKTAFDEIAIEKIKKCIAQISKAKENKTSKSIIVAINQFDECRELEKAKERWNTKLREVANSINVSYEDIKENFCYVSAKNVYLAKQLDLLFKDPEDPLHCYLQFSIIDIFFFLISGNSAIDAEFIEDTVRMPPKKCAEVLGKEEIEKALSSSNIKEIYKAIIKSSRKIKQQKQQEFLEATKRF